MFRVRVRTRESGECKLIRPVTISRDIAPREGGNKVVIRI